MSYKVIMHFNFFPVKMMEIDFDKLNINFNANYLNS